MSVKKVLKFLSRVWIQPYIEHDAAEGVYVAFEESLGKGLKSFIVSHEPLGTSKLNCWFAWHLRTRAFSFP
jgi:hypothetical protein